MKAHSALPLPDRQFPHEFSKFHAEADDALLVAKQSRGFLAHKGLQRWRELEVEARNDYLGRATANLTRLDVMVGAAQQVGKPLFFSLLIITVSFLPVFALGAVRPPTCATRAESRPAERRSR